MPFEEALILMNMGRLSRDRQRLEQALELFGTMGTTYFVGLVGNELRRIQADVS